MMIEENASYQLTFSFTQEEVNTFANISKDLNPIHIDPEYAAKTAFKMPIIPGFLGASVFSRVFGTLFPGEGTVYLKQSLEFRLPMYVDTKYEAIFTVKELNRGRHIAKIDTKILQKETQKVVVRGEASVMNPQYI